MMFDYGNIKIERSHGIKCQIRQELKNIAFWWDYSGKYPAYSVRCPLSSWSTIWSSYHTVLNLVCCYLIHTETDE